MSSLYKTSVKFQYFFLPRACHAARTWQGARIFPPGSDRFQVLRQQMGTRRQRGTWARGKPIISWKQHVVVVTQARQLA
jgi:hypothetical protein